VSDKNIEAKVKQLLAENLNVSTEKIKLSSFLSDDLGIDSFGSIEIVYALEKEFSIKILEDDVMQMKTVEDIVEYIENKTKIKGK